MLVYEKVAWLQYVDEHFSLRRIFGKEKLKKLQQGFSILSQQGISWGIVPLTLEMLYEFNTLYTTYIATKHNPHPVDLVQQYEKKLEANQSTYYFAFFRDQSRMLLGGAIFAQKSVRGKKGLMLGFRAFEPHQFNKLSVGYYLEYLYFTFGIDLQVDVFSRGVDRNFYGLLGSNVGLPIHKAQLWFLPYISPSNLNPVDLESVSIQEDTICFSQVTDNNPLLAHVTVWTKLSLDEAQDKYGIFTKRGLTVSYLSL